MSKHRAVVVDCPECSAPALMRCRKADGSVRRAYHRARHSMASRIPLSKRKDRRMSRFIDHPLANGDKKRARALEMLSATTNWPSVRDLAKLIDWSIGTSHAFLNSVQRWIEQNGELNTHIEHLNGVQLNGVQTHCEPAKSTLVADKVGVQLNAQIEHQIEHVSPTSQKLSPHPSINNYPPSSASVSEPSSLRSLEPETPAGAPKRATQPRLDFDHAEEQRADLLKALIFDHGVRLLMSHGCTDATARSFLGKRIAEIGREPLAMAVARAVIEQIAEPRAYLAACARDGNRPSQYGAPRHDEVRRDPWDFGDDDTDGGAHGPH